MGPSGVTMIKLPMLSVLSRDGKSNSQFKQWLYEVWVLQAIYLKVSLKKAIIWSLKGDAANSVQYIGVDAKVEDMIQKLEGQYGQVASSDVLPQTFYQMILEKNKQVQMVTGRSEGNLNQLKLKFPQMVQESDVSRQLQDRLFYGMNKTLRHRINYLYNNPTIDYPQLKLVAHKAESEIADVVKTTVKVKATSVTDEKNNEIEVIWDQITQLMSAVKSNESWETNKHSFKNKWDAIVLGARLISKGPLKEGYKPIQCLKCRGWYPSYKNCTTMLNFMWEEYVEGGPLTKQKQHQGQSNWKQN